MKTVNFFSESTHAFGFKNRVANEVIELGVAPIRLPFLMSAAVYLGRELAAIFLNSHDVSFARFGVSLQKNLSFLGK